MFGSLPQQQHWSSTLMPPFVPRVLEGREKTDAISGLALGNSSSLDLQAQHNDDNCYQPENFAVM